MDTYQHANDLILQVALPVPVGNFFDYLPLAGACDVGVRVRVPFGNRQLVGIVVGLGNKAGSQVPTHKLKTIIEVLDTAPIIDDGLLKLAGWLAGYYHYPLGEVLGVMLPTLINQGKPLNQHTALWQVIDSDGLEKLPKTAKKQRQIFQHMLAYPDGLDSHSLHAIGATTTIINALHHKGLIDARPSKKATTPRLVHLKDEHLPANDEQTNAINAIKNSIKNQQYQGFLLNGITGSGKTEVYLQAMHQALMMGRQVLILVPEIGLTPQTAARFQARFDAHICILHSGMNDKERLQGWQDCQSGSAQIIIGTRSSILYPFHHLGLIIIDEAHDTSYKQQDHLRYHACDVALLRGLWQKIPVVLGTATPSLEHAKLVIDGKLTQLTLNHRAANNHKTHYQLIDTKLDRHTITLSDGQIAQTAFASQTIRAIRERLSLGEQVLIFLNRRGYAPVLICHACAWQADCPNCDAHLTLHKNERHHWLKCHHCGHQITPPHTCPECNSPNLSQLGNGTGRLVEQLHAIFANPQHSQQTYPIWQIDRDTMQKKGAWQQLNAQIQTGQPAILVGTQMIAKGHHFPKVTLVVIADADLGFLSPDFRSPEHTAQQIIQVAGRAGRADRQGTVMIQTINPANPALITLVRDGYQTFAKQLLQERQLLGLPPFSHAALIRADSHDYAKAKNAIIGAKNALPNRHSFAINAPVDAPMTKKNTRYQVQMLILSKDRKALHDLLNHWWQTVQHLSSSKGVRLFLDIDPMGW